jgi:hypothetical protein
MSTAYDISLWDSDRGFESHRRLSTALGAPGIQTGCSLFSGRPTDHSECSLLGASVTAREYAGCFRQVRSTMLGCRLREREQLERRATTGDGSFSVANSDHRSGGVQVHSAGWPRQCWTELHPCLGDNVQLAAPPVQAVTLVLTKEVRQQATTIDQSVQIMLRLDDQEAQSESVAVEE